MEGMKVLQRQEQVSAPLLQAQPSASIFYSVLLTDRTHATPCGRSKGKIKQEEGSHNGEDLIQVATVPMNDHDADIVLDVPEAQRGILQISCSMSPGTAIHAHACIARCQPAKWQ